MGGFHFLLIIFGSLGMCVCEGVGVGLKHSPLGKREHSSSLKEKILQSYLAARIHDNLNGDILYSCNGTQGWRMVGFVNMTDPKQDCPSGLEINKNYSIRLCAGGSNSYDSICNSTTFSVGGQKYSQVCGRIKAYQYGYAYAFYQNWNYNYSIEQCYVDGVSLTYGPAGNRQHIWTFAASAYIKKGFPFGVCPCDNNYSTSPYYVGENYFCETGNINDTFVSDILFKDHPLWSRYKCGTSDSGSISSPCCLFHDPPWFTKTLPTPTTEDIELRLCLGVPVLVDVPIELIELYVK